MPRQAPEVRRAATRRIKEMIDLVARQSPDWGQPGAHERALFTVATMVGALVLARAVDEPRLSDGAARSSVEASRSDLGLTWNPCLCASIFNMTIIIYHSHEFSLLLKAFP